MDYGHTGNLMHEPAEDFSSENFDTVNFVPQHDKRNLGNRAIFSSSDNSKPTEDFNPDSGTSNGEATPLGQIVSMEPAPEVKADAIAARDFYPRGEHISRETKNAVEHLREKFNQNDEPLGDVYDEIIAARAAYQSNIAAKDLQ